MNNWDSLIRCTCESVQILGKKEISEIWELFKTLIKFKCALAII